MLQDGIDRGDQPMFHLTGDSTIRMIVDALKELPKEKARKMRVRFEHGTAIAPELIKELQDKGVIVVVNPVHPLHDTTIHFLNHSADKDFDPVKSLLQQGIPVAIGSNGPPNPFLNIMLAMVRPEESLLCEEAVIAYPKTAAYAEISEKDKGTLEKGKLADLVVLSQDIFSVQPPQLMAKKVLLIPLSFG